MAERPSLHVPVDLAPLKLSPIPSPPTLRVTTPSTLHASPAVRGAFAPGLLIGSPALKGAFGGAPGFLGGEGQETLELLRAENAQLRERVENLEAQVGVVYRSPRLGGIEGPVITSPRALVKLESGVQSRLTATEMASMRQIFHLFDTHGEGKISAGDLQALHLKLGEPLTDDEAADMILLIGQGRGHISFDDFIQYWDGVHPSQRSAITSDGIDAWSLDDARSKKKQHHQARFKFLKAKLFNPAVGRIYIEHEGSCPSLEYRVRFYYDDEDSGERVQISAWHDVPYRNTDGTINMIVEIPKWSRRKFELATGELFNPIKQDVKNGVLREYAYGDMMWNYGCVPQTWEDPKITHHETLAGGDNDPLDIIDIGSKMWSVGSIVRVRVLGALAMIDAGETDWKLIAINCEDPLADVLNDIDDVFVHMPGCVEALHRWLKYYKSPVINTFGFGGAAQSREFAESLIDETHRQWEELLLQRGKAPLCGAERVVASGH